MLLLQLSQCISSGCHHATPTPNIFLEVSLLWEGALRFRFDLASVIIQGATMPNLNPKFFLELSLLWEGGIMLLLRLSRGISSRCHHANHTPKCFWNCHCGMGTSCFCFDITKVFLQGGTMTTLNPQIFELVIIVGRGIMLLLRLSQGISLRCHHANPTPKKFRLFIIVGRGIMFLFRLSQIFRRGATMPTLQHQNFFGFVIIEGRGYYSSAST